ncbi:MAG: SDR family NAD(P)-dependent oxidoreductase [Flavobacteriaceae bacterium]
MKKNILIIGGSKGIGLAITRKLQKENTLFIASRTREQLVDPNITHIPFDATTDELDASLLPQHLDGFVYCPGSIILKPFKMLDMDTFGEDMEINFLSMVKIVKAVLPKMTKGAAIVLFSTVAVGTGMPYHTSIAAAKGAIEGFSKALAAEYAPNIRVNVIAPSLVDTPLAKRLLNNDRKREQMANRHPLQRVGEAEDIANCAVFLLSSESSWITGQILRPDGGMSSIKRD